jgi:ABC-type sugar transport system ATPase subunit
VASVSFSHIAKVELPDGTRALWELDLDVAVVVLVGPSGSGKTTALRWSPVLRNHGRASTDPRSRPEPLRDIAVVFQLRALPVSDRLRQNRVRGVSGS